MSNELIKKSIAEDYKYGFETDVEQDTFSPGLDENVIQKLYDIKKRVIKKKFILLLADDRQLNKYIKEVPEVAWDILDYSIKQPTIIYPNAYNLSKLLIADDGSIAVRIAELDYLQQIIDNI